MDVTPAGKLWALESLRGLAAAAVVVAHLTMAFADPYPTGRPAGLESWPGPLAAAVELVYRPVRDGQFAVMVFFVLSGVVLSQGYLRRGQFPDLFAGIVKRYPRLAIPAAASAVLACLLWQAGGMFNAQAATALTDRGLPATWLASFRQDEPTLAHAARQAGWDVFFGPTMPPPGDMYNAVLWTMRTEFWGSLLVYGLLGLCGTHPRVARIAAAVAVVLGGIGQLRLAAFPAGVALAAFRRDRPDAKLSPLATIEFAVAAFVLCGWYRLGEFRSLTSWPGGFAFQWEDLVTVAAAVLTVAVVLFAPAVSRALSAKPLVWLGSVSFGLYLVHLPVILSLGSFVFARTMPLWGHGVAFALTSFAVLTACLPAAWLLTVLVDGPAVRLCHHLGRLVRRP
jgi:peptidoglycan/LPS O-acetylase OafA/YrhL